MGPNQPFNNLSGKMLTSRRGLSGVMNHFDINISKTSAIIVDTSIIVLCIVSFFLIMIKDKKEIEALISLKDCLEVNVIRSRNKSLIRITFFAVFSSAFLGVVVVLLTLLTINYPNIMMFFFSVFIYILVFWYAWIGLGNYKTNNFDVVIEHKQKQSRRAN